MSCVRRMRNTSRQATLTTRLGILSTFTNKLKSSGHLASTICSILESGLRFYFRKVRTQLEGGPPLNSKGVGNHVEKKRAKMGAAERWFKRRRGGQEEKDNKNNSWRRQGPSAPMDPAQPSSPPPQGRRRCGVQQQQQCWQQQGRQQQDQEQVQEQENLTGYPLPDLIPGTLHGMVDTTLLVPYTPGSRLKKLMQTAEDDFSRLTCTRRVRIVEAGGNKLAHMLGRNDPWAHLRTCEDPACPTCRTKVWLKEQKDQARKAKEKLPIQLLLKTSTMCHREGALYTAQCIHCIHEGKKTLYKGMTSRSACQRTLEHYSAVENGTTTSPLVEHSIMEHGGKKPEIAYLIDDIEGRALYRAVKEAVKIANMGDGPLSMNRCGEWGAPRVPILTVLGGDPEERQMLIPGAHNPRQEWSTMTMEKIQSGSMKRIVYWDPEETIEETNPPTSNPVQHRHKRRRRDKENDCHQEQDQGLGAVLVGTGVEGDHAVHADPRDQPVPQGQHLAEVRNEMEEKVPTQLEQDQGLGAVLVGTGVEGGHADNADPRDQPVPPGQHLAEVRSEMEEKAPTQMGQEEKSLAVVVVEGETRTKVEVTVRGTANVVGVLPAGSASEVPTTCAVVDSDETDRAVKTTTVEAVTTTEPAKADSAAEPTTTLATAAEVRPSEAVNMTASGDSPEAAGPDDVRGKVTGMDPTTTTKESAKVR